MGVLTITPVCMIVMVQSRLARQVALECWIQWIEGCFREGHNRRGLVMRLAINQHIARLLTDSRPVLTRLVGGCERVMEAEDE